MNPNTAAAAVPSAAPVPQPQATRAADRSQGPRDQAFSAALERELAPRPVQRPAEAEPGPAAGATRPARPTASGPAADAGTVLPEGGKARPPAADAARGPAVAGHAGETAVDESLATLPGGGLPDAPGTQPGLPAAFTTPEAMPTTSGAGPSAAVAIEPAGGAEPTAAADHGEWPEPADGPLFDYFTRTLDMQGIGVPGVASPPGPLPVAGSRADEAALDAQAADPLCAAGSVADPQGQPGLLARLGQAADAAAGRGSEGTVDAEPVASSLLDAGVAAGAGEARPGPEGMAAASSLPTAAQAVAAAAAAAQGAPVVDGVRPGLYTDLVGGRSDGLPTGAAAVLAATVGSQEWFDQLGAGLRWQVGEGVSEARLRLNPAELGTLDVQVRVTERGTEVHFVAPHAHAREALEQGMQRLRDSLDAQGLQLADASVSDGRAGPGGHGQPAPTLPGGSGGPWSPEDDPTGVEGLPGARPEGHGLIDLYA